MLKFLLFFLVSLLFACQSSPQNKAKTITIAASSIPQAELLEQIQEDLKQEGITLKIKVVDDYNIPNRALAEGEIDANFFQHKPFLEEQIHQFNYPICCLAEIHIEPLGIYLGTKNSLKELPEGSLITLPNDPTNEARALLLLEKAGLITLEAKNLSNTTVLDIKENSRHFKFKEIDAALLARTLQETGASVIPTNYALLAGLSPIKDAVFIEDKTSPYINIIAVRCDDLEKNELVLLKKKMQSEKMHSYILTKYQGAVIPAF